MDLVDPINNSSINHSFQVNIHGFMCYVAVSCPRWMIMSWHTTNCKVSCHSAYQALFLAHWNLLHQSTLQFMLFMLNSYHCTSDNQQLQAMWADFCVWIWGYACSHAVKWYLCPWCHPCDKMYQVFPLHSGESMGKRLHVSTCKMKNGTRQGWPLLIKTTKFIFNISIETPLTLIWIKKK